MKIIAPVTAISFWVFITEFTQNIEAATIIAIIIGATAYADAFLPKTKRK